MNSKRKRSYHRALKRGELWALMEKARREIILRIYEDLYCPPSNIYAVNSITGLNELIKLKVKDDN